MMRKLGISAAREADAMLSRDWPLFLRGVFFDKSRHLVRLILNQVVHAAFDLTGCDVSEAVCTKTICDLGNHLRERGFLSGAQEQRHLTSPAMGKVEFNVGRKRAVHFKGGVNLRRRRIRIHVVGSLTGRELTETEKI